MKKPASSKRINTILVHAKPGEPTKGFLRAGSLVLPCALGKGGISAFKREGDGATPLASMQLLYGFKRGSKGCLPATSLNIRPIRKDDGWCDTPKNPNYNRPVKLPCSVGHEKMFRDDHLYDVCLVMDWNIRSRKRGCGSAIFMHLARDGYQPTEGCIALSRPNMMRLLPHLAPGTRIRVIR